MGGFCTYCKCIVGIFAIVAGIAGKVNNKIPITIFKTSIDKVATNP